MSMISTLTPRRLPILEIFKHAKDQGYTKYGEMFSVNNMKSLINASPLSIWFDAVIYSGGILPRKKQIIAAMCKGALILIPYDADKNYAPVCLMGHKAHWAVLCGIIDDSKNCVVVARQGKSKYVSLWLLDELDRSNNNLMECDPERAKCGFVISDLSLELAGKYIVLNPKSQSKDVHILTNII
ncbi:hypothetical protein AAG570_012806 [Ranatra chinensis]|uniref:Actin maturation protease n=1 Tax=Ranatra chinensis TaxID=642074 RepID=A0ABD0YTK9_9HEMI